MLLAAFPSFTLLYGSEYRIYGQEKKEHNKERHILNESGSDVQPF